MKILHSSDWHLGRRLYGKQRYAEFRAFLEWLLDTLSTQHIDVLLVAGDIFDTTTPSYKAQELYYEFLYQVSTTCCQHVVIVAGNHDSPAFLAAPQSLLKHMQIHVVSSVRGPLDEQVLLLHDRQQQPQLIVCAVPYLRDQELRLVEAHESLGDKDQKLLHAIQQHYAHIALAAKQLQQSLPSAVPIIATGHLFTTGGQVLQDDGVRDLYVGNSAQVPVSLFSSAFDYVALGHLHIPQKVGAQDHIRYSGSPLPMGFGEARQQKSVVVIEFSSSSMQINTVAIPRFQALERIQGNWEHITTRLQQLIKADQSVWVELIYDSDQLMANLREQIFELTEHTAIEVLRIQNHRLQPQQLNPSYTYERLEELDVHQVFERCLDSHQIRGAQRIPLLETYAEALVSFYQQDITNS